MVKGEAMMAVPEGEITTTDILVPEVLPVEEVAEEYALDEVVEE
jgi:hypothetical protein